MSLISEERIDSSIITNPAISLSLSSGIQKPEDYEELCEFLLPDFPMNTYLKQKKDTDVLFQHPLLLSFNDIDLEDKEKNFPNDLLNKWFENTSLKNFYLSLYSNEIFLNGSKTQKDTSNLLIELRKNLKSQMEQLENDSQLKSNFMIVKLGINSLSSITEENLDVSLKYAKSMKESFSKFFEEYYELIFLFGKDFFKMFNKIDKLIDQIKTQENQIKLLDIIFYLSSCFKSLYGFLFLIKKIQDLNLESIYTSNQIMECNEYYLKHSYFTLIDDEMKYKNLYIDIEKGEFILEDTSACYATRDLIFFYNNNIGFLKVHKLQTNQNSYNVIKNVYKEEMNNEYKSLFSFDEQFLLSFSFEHYKKNNNADNQKLIHLYDLDLNEIKGKIIFDDKASNVLFSKASEIYLPILDKDIIYKDDIPLSKKNVAIYSEDTFIYILHPIFEIPKNATCNIKYFSKSYIYAIDIFEISYHNNDMIKISFKETQILSKVEEMRENVKDEEKKDEAKSEILENLFTTTFSLNKFIVVNGIIYTNEGYLIYNTKTKQFTELNDKTVSQFNCKNNDEGSIVISHKDKILYLIILPDTMNHFIIKEKAIKAFSYQSSNLFSSHPLFKELTTNSNPLLNEKQTSDTQDIIEEIFSTNFLEYQEEKTVSNEEQNKTKENQNTILYILSTLCEYIFNMQYHTMNSDQMELSIKSPYILSNDFPTLLLFDNLLKRNISNEKILFPLLMIFDLHLTKINQMKIPALSIFGKEEKIQDMIDTLKQIGEKNKSLTEIAYTLIFKLLCLDDSYPKEKFNTLIDSIFFNNGNITLDDMIAKSEIYKEYFKCVKFSQKNFKKAIESKCGKSLYIITFRELISNEIEYIKKSNFKFKKFCFEYEQYFTFSYSYFLKDKSEINELFNEMTCLLLKTLSHSLLKEIIDNDYLDKSFFAIPLLKYVTMISINNFKTIQNIFTLQNWSHLLNIIEILSNIREEKNLIPVKDRNDIIIDNIAFSDGQNREIIYIPSKKNFEYLYIQGIFVAKASTKIDTSTNLSIGTIEDIQKGIVLLTFGCWLNMNKFQYYSAKLPGEKCKKGIKINLAKLAKGFLVKIRISNYQFYSDKTDSILEPCLELFNNMLKKLACYYEQDPISQLKNTNEKEKNKVSIEHILHLFNTRLFSQGIFSSGEFNFELKDVYLFKSFLSDSSSKYALELKDKIDLGIKNKKKDISTSIIVESSSIENLVNNKEYNKVLNSFDKKLKIIIQGDIPNKIVRYAFYSIIRHEKLFGFFDSYVTQFNKNKIIPQENEEINIFFFIWKECSELRRAYKSIKDEFISENVDNIDESFSSIFKKMEFLFKLNPQFEISPLFSHKISKSYGNKFNKGNLKLYIQIIKEHIINLTEIIQNKGITIESIIQGYQKMQTKAKFREISLLILNSIINNLNDTSIKGNILTNYYSNFMKIEHSVPSIYQSLACVNENIVKNITNSFHLLLNSIINKVKNEEMSNFDLSIYLNCLIWKIRKRNYEFFVRNNIFDLLENELNLKQANTFIFVFPEANSQSKFDHFNEIRPIDSCHLGKILTDILSYYSKSIVQLEKKEEFQCNEKNEINNNNLKLVRMNSVLQQDNFFIILEYIVEALNKQFEKIITVFDNKEKGQYDIEYTFPFEEKNHDQFSKHMIQIKLYNALIEFNKLCFEEYRKSSIIFDLHSIWITIVKLIKYANEKNTKLIFNLIKLFTKVEKNNIGMFYNKYTNNKENFPLVYEKFYNLIFESTQYKNLVCDFFKFIYFSVDKNSIEKYITYQITKENRVFFFKFFNYDLISFDKFTPVLVNTKLGLENKKVNYIPPQNELELYIKKGFLLGREIKNVEEFKDLEIDLNSSGNFSNDEYSNSNSSSVSISENEMEEEEQKSFFFHNKGPPIIRDLPVLLNKLSNNSIDSFLANENELVYNEKGEEQIPVNEQIIDFCIEYLNANLLKNKKKAPKFILEYIQITKCLYKNSHNKKVKKFITDNQMYLNEIFSFESSGFSFSLFSLQKIEHFLFNSIQKLSESELVNERENALTKINHKEKTRISYGRIIDDNTLTIYNERTDKIMLPIYDTTRLTKCEYSFYSHPPMQIYVLNEKEYEDEVTRLKEVESEVIEKNVKKWKMVFICEDLITKLGVNEKGIFEKERKIEFIAKKSDKKSRKSSDDFENSVKSDKDEKLKDKEEKEDKGIMGHQEEKEGKKEDVGDKEDKDEKENKEDDNDKEDKKEEEKDKKEENCKDKDKEDDKDKKDNNKYEEINYEDINSQDWESCCSGSQKEEIIEVNNSSYKKEISSDKESQFNEKESKSKESNKKNDTEEKKESENNSSLSSISCEFYMNSQDSKGNKKEGNQDKDISQTKEKFLNEDKWEEFTINLNKIFQFSSCLFIIESKFFNKIPINFYCCSYPSNLFPTENLTPSNIYSKIQEKTIPDTSSLDLLLNSVLNSKNINIDKPIKLNKSQDQEKSEKSEKNDKDNKEDKNDKDDKEDKDNKDNKKLTLYESLCQQYKIKTKNISNKDKIKDRFLIDKDTFYNLYETTPNLEEKTDGIEEIEKVGFYILKHYINLLYLKLELPISFSSLKSLFHSSYYYKNNFNLTDEYEIIKKGIYKYLTSIKSPTEIQNIIIKSDICDYQSKILKETSFNQILQDTFLKEMLTYYQSNNQYDYIHIIYTNLLKKAELLLYSDKHENCFIIFSIITDILSNCNDISFFKEIFALKYFISLTETAFSTKKIAKSDFSVLCLEFLMTIVVIAKEKGFETELEIDKRLLELCKDFDVVQNKLNSMYLIEKLAIEDKEYKQKTLHRVILPKHRMNFYALKIKIDYTDKFTIESNTSLKANELYSIIDNNDESSLQILDKTVDIKTNSITIIHDSKSALCSKIVSGFKLLHEDECETKEDNIYITDIYNFSKNSATVLKDIKGKYYYIGSFTDNSSSTEVKINQFKELNKISETEQILSIGDNCVLTSSAVYFLSSYYPDNLDTISYGEHLRRFPLRINEKCINAKFDNFLLILTEKHTLYGASFRGDESALFENSDEIASNQLKEIKIPKHLKVIEYESEYDILIYLAYDTKLGKNLVFANGKNTTIHLFENDEDTKFFAREITFFSDKNIQTIKKDYKQYFLALSADGKVYYVDIDKYKKYGIYTAEYFINNNIFVTNLIPTGRCLILKGRRESDDKELYFAIGIIDNLNDFSYKDKGYSHKSRIKSPALIDFDLYERERKESEKEKEKLKNKNKPITSKTLIALIHCLYKLHALFQIYTPTVDINSIQNYDKPQNEFNYTFISHDAQFEISLIGQSNEKDITSFIFNITKPKVLLNVKLKYNELCRFYDKSSALNGISEYLIEQLSQFTNTIKSVDQIVITATKDTMSLMNMSTVKNEYVFYKSEEEETEEEEKEEIDKLDIYISPNNKADKKYSILKEKITNKIKNLFKEVTPDYLIEFLRSKDFYTINEKSIGKSFNDYLIEKYHNYDQYQKLSIVENIDIISIVLKQLILSSQNLLKFSSVTSTSFSKVIFNNMEFIDKEMRESYYNKFFKALKTDNHYPTISISRSIAIKNKGMNLVDSNYEWTIFSQLYNSLCYYKPSMFLKRSEDKLFKVHLEGENAIDAGGPFREILSSSFEELNSPYLDLFIPTPNNKSKSGSDRDKYTINPKAKSEKHLKIFEFLGRLFAYIISTGFYIPLSLSSFVYKQILNHELNVTDIKLIDIHSYNSIIQVLSKGTQKQKEQLFNIIDFTCILSNGDSVELIPEGKSTMVNKDNVSLYLELYLKTRINECSEQALAIRKGLTSVIPEQILNFLTWEDLERKLCGEPFFNLELLKRNTIYEGYKESDATIQFFWKFLGKCTLEEQYQYLKFAWGRTRLPKDDSGFKEEHHEIDKMGGLSSDEVNKKLPVAHTCFFSIDLPPYTSYEVLKEKLSYAMRNSLVITDEGNTFNFDI